MYGLMEEMLDKNVEVKLGMAPLKKPGQRVWIFIGVLLQVLKHHEKDAFGYGF